MNNPRFWIALVLIGVSVAVSAGIALEVLEENVQAWAALAGLTAAGGGMVALVP